MGKTFRKYKYAFKRAAKALFSKEDPSRYSVYRYSVWEKEVRCLHCGNDLFLEYWASAYDVFCVQCHKCSFIMSFGAEPEQVEEIEQGKEESD